MNQLFTITGTSGSGKTSVARALFKPENTIISYTSREPRLGENDGIDYYFTSKEKMLEMRDKNEFLEFIEFNGNYYGYSKNEVISKLKKNDCVAVITWDGLEAFLNNDKIRPYIIPIFFDTSINKIKKNLQNRKDSKENIESRLKLYEKEHSENMDFYNKIKLQGLKPFLINTDDKNLRALIKEVKNIIDREKAKESLKQGEPASIERAEYYIKNEIYYDIDEIDLVYFDSNEEEGIYTAGIILVCDRYHKGELLTIEFTNLDLNENETPFARLERAISL